MENITSLVQLNIPSSAKPRVVIIGGGFGGLNTVRSLKSDDFQIVLFDKHNYHTFQPLLYQVATAGLQPDSIAAPLRKALSKKHDFYFRMMRVKAVHPENNSIETELGPLTYDYLVVANGSTSNFFGNDRIKQFSLPLKSIPEALDVRSQVMQLCEAAGLVSDPGLKETMLDIVVVGGGPTGIEMSGAIAELRKHVLPKDYPALDFSQMKIYLLEGMDRLLPTMSSQAGAYALKSLEKMGVIVKLKSMVENCGGEAVTLKGGERIPTSTILWTAGVMGDLIPGFNKEWIDKGRLVTDEKALVKGSRNIFAIGDIAFMKTERYPKGLPGLAQPAIQLGKYIGRNLKSIHAGQPVKPFVYFDKGSLATIGRGKAVADLPGNIHFGGRFAWWIWLFVHISFLISFRNKLLVFTSWVWNYFTFDKGNRLIIRPYIKPEKTVSAPELIPAP
jgi:NADH dehydrogenase